MQPMIYNQLLLFWAIIAVIVFFINLRVVAPYGRHTNRKWGPMINNRFAWFLMELTALVSTTIFTFSTEKELEWFIYLFYGLFALHYVNRAFVYPLRIRDRTKRMPIIIMLMAMLFNAINGFFIGFYLSHATIEFSWLVLIVGLIIFVCGFYINIRSDNILLKLKKHSNEYQVPEGFLFSKISCPNHFGEILEWIGYAILSMNPGAAAFAIWTAANLIPRSLAHHRWYKQTFEKYPENRKAIFPGIL